MVWNRDTAWKQFSILSKDNLEKVGYESSLQDNSIGIVVSHSCDIANSLEVEPYIEVVIGTLLTDSCNGSFTHGKNNRKLHLTLDNSPKGYQTLELIITTKFYVAKEKILKFDIQPDDCIKLKSNAYRTILRWLTIQYDKKEFPDSYNNLMGKTYKLHEKIKKILTKESKDEIRGLFLKYKETEKSTNVFHYDLVILVLYDTSEDPNSAEQIAQTVCSKITEKFEAIPVSAQADNNQDSIHLKQAVAIADSSLTYQQYETLIRWEPGDDLSMAEEGKPLNI